jgi:hypothetical protein
MGRFSQAMTDVICLISKYLGSFSDFRESSFI